MNLAGRTINVEGKAITCPSYPIYLVKSFGYTVDTLTRSGDAHASFNSCTAAFRELWKMTAKGTLLVRRIRNGREG